jgi:hypothetical protein
MDAPWKITADTSDRDIVVWGVIGGLLLVPVVVAVLLLGGLLVEWLVG